MVIASLRTLARWWWVAVPHGFRSSGQFSSYVCAKCGKRWYPWHIQ